MSDCLNISTSESFLSRAPGYMCKSGEGIKLRSDRMFVETYLRVCGAGCREDCALCDLTQRGLSPGL